MSGLLVGEAIKRKSRWARLGRESDRHEPGEEGGSGTHRPAEQLHETLLLNHLRGPLDQIATTKIVSPSSGRKQVTPFGNVAHGSLLAVTRALPRRTTENRERKCHRFIFSTDVVRKTRLLLAQGGPVQL